MKMSLIYHPPNLFYQKFRKWAPTNRFYRESVYNNLPSSPTVDECELLGEEPECSLWNFEKGTETSELL